MPALVLELVEGDTLGDPPRTGPPTADGFYYSRSKDDTRCIEKAAIDGGPAISVRCDNAVAPAPTRDGSALYFAHYLTTTNGIVDYEIRRARPENGPSELLARVAGSRVPVSRRLFTPVLSPDGKWLTMPLTDGATSNVWVLPTSGERMRPSVLGEPEDVPFLEDILAVLPDAVAGES